jgi:transcriptional antiterminator RfaH
MIIAGAADSDLARSLNADDAVNNSFLDSDVEFRPGRDWWVFYTKARQEKALARQLAARRVPHYLPLHKKYSICRGRRLTSYVPLFPGYVFLFVDWEERAFALASNRVARTIDVPSGGQSQLAEDLQQIHQVIASGVPLTPESRILPGEAVRIKSGRLAGLEGVVTKRRGESRLLVAVNYLQQGASIELDDFALEAI